MLFRNSTRAFVACLDRALSKGTEVHVRGQKTLELHNCVLDLEHPLERCIILPQRLGNIFASIAETIWVVSGRNDLAFLTHYLPRAPDFSDDGGVTWRAAYGKRLRDWAGVDQLAENLKILAGDAYSRRAVLSLFDPAKDFVDSRDIPCNNWLHWMIRDEALHLNIVVRSNDLVWGFSGINSFEWSFLHELMALSLGKRVGKQTFFISSLHLYERHFERAKEIVSLDRKTSCYEHDLSSPRLITPFSEIDGAFRSWFAIEDNLRQDAASCDREIEAFPDPLLRQFLQMLQLYNGHKRGWHVSELNQRIAAMPETDLTVAALDYFQSRSIEGIQPSSSHTRARAFLEGIVQESRPLEFPEEQFRKALRLLHADKTAAYGTSWKRRGEPLSILPNIARKVDRLAIGNSDLLIHDETQLDTAVDLLVYCLKYELFLSDRMSGEPESPGFQSSGLSDGLAGFDALVDSLDLSSWPQGANTYQAASAEVARAFDTLSGHWSSAQARVDTDVRARDAQTLRVAALKLLDVVTRSAPSAVRDFLERYGK